MVHGDLGCDDEGLSVSERCDCCLCYAVSVLTPRPVTQCGPWWWAGCVSGSTCTESTRPRCRDACLVPPSERPRCEYTLCVRGSAYLRYCIQFMAGHVPLCIPHVKKKGSSLLMHCITFKKVQVL